MFVAAAGSPRAAFPRAIEVPGVALDEAQLVLAALSSKATRPTNRHTRAHRHLQGTPSARTRAAVQAAPYNGLGAPGSDARVALQHRGPTAFGSPPASPPNFGPRDRPDDLARQRPLEDYASVDWGLERRHAPGNPPRRPAVRALELDLPFRGRDTVPERWTAILRDVPDFGAELLRSAVDVDEEWGEWRWRGTRADGSAIDVRGVTIVDVRAGRIAWGRFYLEEAGGAAGTCTPKLRASS